MTKPVTYIALILDQSGSMSSLRREAVEFYNEQVQQAKLNAKDQDIYCSLLTFNGNVFEHLWNVPANDLKQSTDEDYVTDGGTALNDALGYAIEKLLRTTSTEDSNVSYLVQVITDGEENSSSHFRRFDPEYRLKKLIEKTQGTGRWTFSFLGCSHNYLENLSKETSVPVTNMAAWNTNNAMAGMKAASNKAGEFLRCRSINAVPCSANYYSDAGTADLYNADLCALQDEDETNLEKMKFAAEEKSNVFNNAKAATWTANAVEENQTTN